LTALGARFYLMRQILHDWSDEKCLEILKPLVAAMDPQDSRLLIAEYVVPSKNVDWLTTCYDLCMCK
jgi:demethylsterigmatocystin 6-O-methyltransferase